LVAGQNWGRWLSLIWVGLVLPRVIAEFIVNVTMEYPVFLATLGPVAPAQASGMRFGFFVGIVFKALVPCIYAGLLTYFMTRPAVRKALTQRKNRSDEYDRDRNADYDRDRYERDYYDDRDRDRYDDRDRDRYDDRDRDRYYDRDRNDRNRGSDWDR